MIPIGDLYPKNARGVVVDYGSIPISGELRCVRMIIVIGIALEDNGKL